MKDQAEFYGIYRNVERIPDTQHSQTKPKVSAPNNQNIQEISNVPLWGRNDLMGEPEFPLIAYRSP